MVRDNGYRQLIHNPTTDNNMLIDHIFTNIVNMETDSGNLETYFTDHKAIWIACKRAYIGLKLPSYLGTLIIENYSIST